jgi:UDP-N-acetylmuramate dehydrogenase
LSEFLRLISGSKFCVLGRGTNVLFPDEGYRGTVVTLTGDFREIRILESKVSSGSGALLSDVLEAAIKNNLIGLEYIAGIPGTVGGAVFGNAGSGDKWISSSINSVEFYKNLNKKLINKRDLCFSYRKSELENCVITKVDFFLKKSAKNDSLDKIYKNIQKRLETQPLNIPNAGSIFKNPYGFNVGKLIETTGLKGKCIGSAQISQLHGNFILNTGGAFAKDVLELIELMKEKVKERFNINLEMEIRIIK